MCLHTNKTLMTQLCSYVTKKLSVSLFLSLCVYIVIVFAPALIIIQICFLMIKKENVTLLKLIHMLSLSHTRTRYLQW